MHYNYRVSNQAQAWLGKLQNNKTHQIPLIPKTGERGKIPVNMDELCKVAIKALLQFAALDPSPVALRPVRTYGI